jgi:hypothetical protein
MGRLEDAELKALKLLRSEQLVKTKVAQYKYPMQELQLAYSQTKGKIYTEEEDRYLLCRLACYGLHSEDVYEKIKRDISDFPVFRFDWFLRSRTPIELNRRCTTLIGLITKEFDGQGGDDDEEEEVEEAPKPKPAPRGKVLHLASDLCSRLTIFHRNGQRLMQCWSLAHQPQRPLPRFQASARTRRKSYDLCGLDVWSIALEYHRMIVYSTCLQADRYVTAARGRLFVYSGNHPQLNCYL